MGKTKTISNIGRKKLCLAKKLCPAKSDFAFTTTSFRPQSTDVTRTRTTRNRKYGHGSAHFFERRITLAVTILSVFVEIPRWKIAQTRFQISNFSRRKRNLRRKKSEEREFENTLARADFAYHPFPFIHHT